MCLLPPPHDLSARHSSSGSFQCDRVKQTPKEFVSLHRMNGRFQQTGWLCSALKERKRGWDHWPFYPSPFCLFPCSPTETILFWPLPWGSGCKKGPRPGSRQYETRNTGKGGGNGHAPSFRTSSLAVKRARNGQTFCSRGFRRGILGISNQKTHFWWSLGLHLTCRVPSVERKTWIWKLSADIALGVWTQMSPSQQSKLQAEPALPRRTFRPEAQAGQPSFRKEYCVSVKKQRKKKRGFQLAQPHQPLSLQQPYNKHRGNTRSVRISRGAFQNGLFSSWSPLRIATKRIWKGMLGEYFSLPGLARELMGRASFRQMLEVRVPLNGSRPWRLAGLVGYRVDLLGWIPSRQDRATACHSNHVHGIVRSDCKHGFHATEYNGTFYFTNFSDF